MGAQVVAYRNRPQCLLAQRTLRSQHGPENVLSLQHDLRASLWVRLRGNLVNMVLIPRGQGAPSDVGTTRQEPLGK